MRSFLEKPPEQSVLYTHLSQRLDSLQSISPAERTALLASARQAIDTQVYPAFRDLSGFLTQQREKAQEEYGVGALPQGDDYYDYLIARHTTASLHAGAVHERGVAEVARVEQEMDRILREQGLLEGSVGARMTQLSHDPRQQYANDDAGRSQCLADYQHVMDEMVGALGRGFVLVPRLPVRVTRMPSFNEGNVATAYADFGTLDGSRPPAFYVNLKDMSGQPKFSIRTIAYHEGVPGHLLQGVIANSLTDVPTFGRVCPYRVSGRVGDVCRAPGLGARLREGCAGQSRAIADGNATGGKVGGRHGIHHEHWSRAQATDYLIDKTGLPHDEVVSEVERYFVMPAQALAYEVGMQEILDLRARAQERLGTKFDVREFHRAVLRDGALRWVPSKRESPRGLRGKAPTRIHIDSFPAHWMRRGHGIQSA